MGALKQFAAIPQESPSDPIVFPNSPAGGGRVEEVGEYEERRRSVPTTREAPIKRLLIWEGDRAFFLPAGGIHWIEAEGNFVRLHAGEQVYRIRATMAALNKRLNPEQFLRVNRSSIVNLDHIAELRICEDGTYDVLLRDGTLLKLSRNYREALERLGGI